MASDSLTQKKFQAFINEKAPFLILTIQGSLYESDVSELVDLFWNVVNRKSDYVIINLKDFHYSVEAGMKAFEPFLTQLGNKKKTVRISGALEAIQKELEAHGVQGEGLFLEHLSEAIKVLKIESKDEEDKNKRGTLLFADPDFMFLSRLSAEVKAKTFPPILCDQSIRVLENLDRKDVEVLAVFLSLDLHQPDAYELIRKILKHHPGMPIYLIEGSRKKFPETGEMDMMGIHGSIQKTTSYEELLRKFLPPRELFDLEEVMRKGKEESKPIGSTLEQGEVEFVPIRAKRFISGSKSLFDLYVKVSDGHYIKILKSGDEFSRERLENYLAKGITEFFIRADLQEQYIGYCDKILDAVNRNKKLTFEAKLSESLEQGERIASFIFQQNGVKEDRLQFATNYVKNIWTLLKNIDIENQSQAIKKFIKDSPGFSHNISTVMFASILAHELGFEAEKSLKIVGVSALFHDVGLLTMDPKFLAEDMSIMSEIEVKAFQRHPVLGAEMMAEIKGIDPVVVQAITQHHWRRDGSGFPNRSGIGMAGISMPAEIIGICDTYVNFVQKYGSKWNSQDRILEESKIFKGFSDQVFQAFQKVFQIKSL